MTDLMKVGWGKWERKGTVSCQMKFPHEWNCHFKLRMSKTRLILSSSAASPLDFPTSTSAIAAMVLPVPQAENLRPSWLSPHPWLPHPSQQLIVWPNMVQRGKEHAALESNRPGLRSSRYHRSPWIAWAQASSSVNGQSRLLHWWL